MRQLVYNAKGLFTNIEQRLNAGERIVIFECSLPDCRPNRGKIFFYKQNNGFVVGICDLNNNKNVQYNGDNRDLKYLVEHKCILYDSIPQIFNMFYRMDAIYSSTTNKMVYYVDSYGYFQDGKYVFSLEKKSGSWRAYIERMPSFEGRDESSSATHRLSDGLRKYVCVQGDVPTKERMKDIAKLWATCEQKYIKTGQRF